MTESIQIMKNCWGNTPGFMVRKVDREFSWIWIENDLTFQNCPAQHHRGSYHCLADSPDWCPDSPCWSCSWTCPTLTWWSLWRDTGPSAHWEDAWSPGGHIPLQPLYLNWIIKCRCIYAIKIIWKFQHLPYKNIRTFQKIFKQNGAIRYFSSDCAFYCYGVSFFLALIDISKQTFSLSFENAEIRSFAYFLFIQQGHKINM